MKFRSESSPPPYFNRRDQLRMLGLVLALCLVVFSIRVVGQPEFWARIFPEEPAVEEQEPPEPRKSDALNVVRADEDDLVKAGADPVVDVEPVDPPAAEPFAARPPKEWLAAIDDDTLGIKSTEAPAFYGLLAMARSVDLTTLEAAVEETPSRTQLMHFPDRFRGQLITIEGYLQRLTPMTVPDAIRTKYGVGNELWDAWVATADAPERPLHVVLTSIPADIPRGLKIGRATKVSVTGWFLKRQSFASGNGPTGTPLIIGREPRYFPPPVMRGNSEELTPYVIGFAVVVGVTLTGVLLWYRASDRRFDDAHVRHFNEAPEGAIESLANIETVDPAEALRKLADSDDP